LLGRALLVESYADDPVWSLLARLASREVSIAPGTVWEAPTDWRLPPAWLTAFPVTGSEEWQWVTQAKRLRLAHPAGFMVLDLPRLGLRPKEQLRSEIAAYPPVALKKGLPGKGRPVEPKSALQFWLSRLLPYVQARLNRALGTTSPGELAALLIERPGKISFSPTHLEGSFALAEWPVELRMAGLDRDPGWVPAAGRFVTFRFE
jgi:hypothetical protein